MEKLWSALAAIGGAAAVGSFLDVLVRQRTEQKIRGTFEGWWLRLNDVEWGNFGRRESIEALAILNEWAGADFISKKRLVFVAAVGGVCALLAALWEAISALVGYLDVSNGATSAIIYAENYWRGV
ncbi:MAG: hypothetical protein WCP68_06965 [Enhydrobacter sp.]